MLLYCRTIPLRIRHPCTHITNLLVEKEGRKEGPMVGRKVGPMVGQKVDLLEGRKEDQKVN